MRTSRRSRRRRLAEGEPSAGPAIRALKHTSFEARPPRRAFFVRRMHYAGREILFPGAPNDGVRLRPVRHRWRFGRRARRPRRGAHWESASDSPRNTASAGPASSAAACPRSCSSTHRSSPSISRMRPATAGRSSGYSLRLADAHGQQGHGDRPPRRALPQGRREGRRARSFDSRAHLVSDHKIYLEAERKHRHRRPDPDRGGRSAEPA